VHKISALVIIMVATEIVLAIVAATTSSVAILGLLAFVLYQCYVRYCGKKNRKSRTNNDEVRQNATLSVRSGEESTPAPRPTRSATTQTALGAESGIDDMYDDSWSYFVVSPGILQQSEINKNLFFCSIDLTTINTTRIQLVAQ
jgi:Ca2+/Na+ antiporter